MKFKPIFYNTGLIKSLLLLTHRHRWNLENGFESTIGGYGIQKFKCKCGARKFVKKYWNRKPIIVIIYKHKYDKMLKKD